MLVNHMRAYHLYVRPNRTDLPLECKGDTRLIARDSFCCASSHLLLPLVADAGIVRVVVFYQ